MSAKDALRFSSLHYLLQYSFSGTCITCHRKAPVTLQKEEDAAPAPPKVLFRRYHNWSAPAVDMFDPSDYKRM